MISFYSKKSKKKKRILAVLLAALIFTASQGSSVSYAAETESEVDTSAQDAKIKEAETKKAQAQESLNKINSQISSIESTQKKLKSQMSEYNTSLVDLLTDLEILQSDMDTQQEEIDQAKSDLEDAKNREAKQYADMKVRIQYMYENGDDNYLTTLLGAENITDLLNRVEYISDVYDYDRDMLTQYQDTVEEVAELEQQLEDEMFEMEELQASMEEEQAELETLVAQLGNQIADFSTQLASAKSLASSYAQTIKQQNAVISEQTKLKDDAVAASKSKSTSSSTSTTTATTTSGVTSGANPSYTTGVSGSAVVSYACQFVGNPYVSGGNSLTTGTDCSGFVNLVYANFGVYVPRQSSAIARYGQEVSYANAQPGDIICYPGHVAIYMGNGKIVHASSSKTGICYGTATYRTISTVRRVL